MIFEPNNASDSGVFGQRKMRQAMGAPESQGGGGGPMPVPEGGPGNWRRGNENQGGGGGPMPIPDPVEGFPGGGGGPMPIPTGGTNWKNLQPPGTGGFHPGGSFAPNEPPPGGGGGPMPIPDPWNAPGANPADFGVTMEFGGPGAINAPGGIANQMPQAPLPPQGRQPYNFGPRPFGPGNNDGRALFTAPLRDPRNFRPPPPMAAGQSPALPMRDPRNFTPPPPMAQNMNPELLRYLLSRRG